MIGKLIRLNDGRTLAAYTLFLSELATFSEVNMRATTVAVIIGVIAVIVLLAAAVVGRFFMAL